MCGVNPRREAFARAVVAGNSLADAYRKAYPASGAWKPESVKKEAARLARTVAPRIAELRGEAAEGAVCTARELAEGLSGLFRAAVGGGRAADAARLAAQIASLLGYEAPKVVDATVRRGPPLSDDELRRIALDEE